MEIKIIYNDSEVTDSKLTSTSIYNQKMLEQTETKKISYSTYDISNAPSK